MSFDIQLVNPGIGLFAQIGAGLGLTLTPHRIAPVRFARAVTGFADASAPDLDDHGFTLCEGGVAHGPVLGAVRGQVILGEVTSGPEVRVKVIRDRLDAAAKLFATSEQEALVQLVSPQPGDPLDPVGTSDPSRGSDIIAFQSTSKNKDLDAVEDCKLFLHHGSVSGPVIAELSVRVYAPRIVPVQVHRVTINGVGPDITLAKLNIVFAHINAIYAQAGVQFIVAQNLLDDSFPEPGDDPFKHTGTITLGDVDDAEGDVFFEMATVLGKFVPGKLNVYVAKHLGLRQLDDLVGSGVSRATAKDKLKDSRLVGLMVRESPDLVMALDSAHEIGHVLGLLHYGDGQPNKKDVREDIWAHRDLMYPVDGISPVSPIPDNRFHSSHARIHVGYGTLLGKTSIGQLFTTKSRAGITQSDQIKTLRTAVKNGDFLPGR